MGIRLNLDDGPVDRASIGDTYAGKELPPPLATLRNNSIRCPQTGKVVVQHTNDDVFLVPVG